MRETPGVRIGVLPWFAAAMAGDPSLVPAPCEAVLRLYGKELRTIDEDLIAATTAALSLETLSPHPVAATGEVAAFLREHLGRKALARVWWE